MSHTSQQLQVHDDDVNVDVDVNFDYVDQSVNLQLDHNPLLITKSFVGMSNLVNF